MKSRIFIISGLFVSLLPVYSANAAPSTDTRLSTLEKTVAGQGQLILELRQQLSNAYRDIDELRGQQEYSSHKIEQIIERQKLILQQIDGDSDTSSKSGVETQSNDVESSDEESNVSISDDKTDYDRIVNLALVEKQYNQAISEFQSFIKNYPKSRYLPNAYYWLGQIYFNDRKFDDASFYFANVVKNYPKSEKAADSMYKIGIILESKGDKVRAKSVYQQVVSSYPNSTVVKNVQKRLREL